MSRHVVCLALLFVVAPGLSKVEGQIVRRIRDRARALAAPPVDPATQVPPPASTSPTPPAEPGLPLGRRGFIARRLQMRRDLVAQQAAEAEPTPAPPAPSQQPRSPQAQAYAQQQSPQPRQALAPQRQTFQALRQASAAVAPTIRPRSRQEISEMNVPALQTTLADSSTVLADELSRFSSATSWRGFLNLPVGIVDEPTVDLAALQTTLSRYEKVALDRQFTQIAGLQSFQQTRAMLTELLNRVAEPTSEPSVSRALADEGPQLIAPGKDADPQPAASTAETLPEPAPQLPRNEGEHSILLRAGS